MSEIALATVGVLVVLFTIYDVFNTTIGLGGGGPLSASLTLRLWRSLPWGPGPMRGFAGAMISLATLLMWMGLLWTGWTLIFLGAPDAVVRASTGEPADLAARIYFTGFTFFTLGLGDYRPDGALWQILTAVCVANGFLTITMSATYLVPMLSAAAQKRALASMIDALGETPADIIINGWHDGSLSSLGSRLSTLSTQIAATSASHLAYPILHTFSSADASRSLPVQIAKLQEALLVIQHGVSSEARPAKTDLMAAHRAVHDYFSDAGQSGSAAPRKLPAPPALERITAAGIPTVSFEDYERVVTERDEMRKRAVGVVEESGWSIDDVLGR